MIRSEPRKIRELLYSKIHLLKDKPPVQGIEKYYLNTNLKPNLPMK
jgi:hypothetical protein